MTYHFVRDLGHSRYPEIKGLTVEQFKEQLAYIKKHYRVISVAELRAAAAGDSDLPPRPLLLTFDDGYLDHFTNVFPILKLNGLTGCFFPPAGAITEYRVLDVNKIHFVLASVSDKSLIVQTIFELLNEFREQHGLMENRSYYDRLAVPNRFDTAEVIFIKRLLQRELPGDLRGTIVNRLFHRFVTTDEASFSQELYMTVDQLSCMRESGMDIGSHGYEHLWLDTLDHDGQVREIDLSLSFLESLGCTRDAWVMSYPYGAYNGGLLSLLRKKGCNIGFTTRVGLADLAAVDPLALSRLDANDLPKKSAAAPNEWTLRA